MPDPLARVKRAASSKRRSESDGAALAVCAKCDVEKPLTEFNRDTRKQRCVKSRCRACVAEDQRLYRSANAEEFREKRRARRSADRSQERRRLYGISEEEYAGLLAIQEGRCAICREHPDGVLAVDHDHETGEVRGLLCRPCNQGLGCLQDSSALLLQARRYLNAPTRLALTHPLLVVKGAATLKSEAQAEYRVALRSAVNAGHSYAELAKLAGVSRQAVRQLVTRVAS